METHVGGENYKFSVGYLRLLRTVSSSSSPAASVYYKKSDHAISTIDSFYKFQKYPSKLG